MTLAVDPLPDRAHHNHRAAEDPPLLRAEEQGKGHGCVLRGADAHPAAVAARRVPHRAVRHPGPVRRLPGHDRRVRQERPRRGAVYRARDRSPGPRRPEEYGAASLSCLEHVWPGCGVLTRDVR